MLQSHLFSDNLLCVMPYFRKEKLIYSPKITKKKITHLAEILNNRIHIITKSNFQREGWFILSLNVTILYIIHSTSMAWTGLGSWKIVLAKGSSSHTGWLMHKMTCRDHNDSSSQPRWMSHQSSSHCSSTVIRRTIEFSQMTDKKILRIIYNQWQASSEKWQTNARLCDLWPTMMWVGSTCLRQDIDVGIKSLLHNIMGPIEVKVNNELIKIL